MDTTATDEQPATVEFDTAGAATGCTGDDGGDDSAGDSGGDDDRGALDVLVERLSGRFDRIMWDYSGHVLCALAAVSDPTIREALRAADVVRALAERHRPVRWPTPSTTVVCSCGSGSYDACPDGLILRGEA